MEETAYMDETNSEIRTQFMEYINTEPDGDGDVKVEHVNVFINKIFNSNYLHFETKYDDGSLVKVTCEGLVDEGIITWYGDVIIQNDPHNPIDVVHLPREELNIGNTILALMIVGVIDNRNRRLVCFDVIIQNDPHNPIDVVHLPREELNIGNTILALMIVGVIDNRNRRLVCFDDCKLKVSANDILTPTITVRTIRTRKDLSLVTIKSLIESKTIDEVVFSDRENLTSEQMQKIFEWAKDRFSYYKVTNAEVALYLWDGWCYEKIRKGRLIPNEIQ